MNDNKELTKQANACARAIIGEIEKELGVSVPLRICMNSVAAIGEAMTHAALLAAPSTRPAPHAGTVGETRSFSSDPAKHHMVEENNEWCEYYEKANARIAELEASLAAYVKEADANHEGLCAERDDLHAQLAAAVRGRDELSIKCMEQNIQLACATPPPPSPDPCVCGQPITLGVVHRKDGPCFHWEPPSPDAKLGELVEGLEKMWKRYEQARLPLSKSDRRTIRDVLDYFTRPAAPSATERKV